MTSDRTWHGSDCDGKHFAMSKKNDHFKINYLGNGNKINDIGLYESVLSLNGTNVNDTLIISQDFSVKYDKY